MKTSEMKNELLMWRLRNAGINAGYDHAETLRKAELRLASWHTAQCNGDIVQDDDTGQCYRQYGHNTMGPFQTVKIADTGKSVENKIKTLCRTLDCYYYIQTDPRGASLYVSADPIADRDYHSRSVCCSI